MLSALAFVEQTFRKFDAASPFDYHQVVLASLLVAIPLSWLVTNKWLEDFAYRIQTERWMFALAGIISLTIALVTLSFQAIKAAIANPVKSLRSE